MPRVFISYARPEMAIAQQLADTITTNGHSVWWDAELYAGDTFHFEITKALDDSQAVIVIWSAAAAKSIWVCAEAMRALRKQKLIPTRLPELEIDDLPLPFDQISMTLVHDFPSINRALNRLFNLRPHMVEEFRVEVPDHLLRREDADVMLSLPQPEPIDLTEFADFATKIRRKLAGEPELSSAAHLLEAYTANPTLSPYSYPVEQFIDACTLLHGSLERHYRETIELIIEQVLRAEAENMVY